MLRNLCNVTTHILIERHSAWRHISEESNLYIHRSHNIKSHMKVFVAVAKDGNFISPSNHIANDDFGIQMEYS
jgi:hypothetical protein